MPRSRLRPRVVVLSAVFATSLAACGSDSIATAVATSGAGPTSAAAAATGAASACPAQSAGATSDNFAETVSLTTTADGLQYGDIVAGTGAQVQKGQNLTVQYTGWLTSGTVFDSSRSAGRTPFSFVIGATPPNVIKGWEEGVLTMHVGGRRRLVIPASLGYGAQGSGCIPANATLVFDVEVVSAGGASPSPT